MAQQIIRVLHVEDNQLVAEAIARKLEGDTQFEWLGWVHSFEGLKDAVGRCSPTVVCMDLQMPSLDPFAMILWLRDHVPSTRVLMITGHVREDQIDKALSAGAWGYLSKGEESSVIVDGIRRVAAGEFVLGTIAKREFGRVVPACPIGPSQSVPKQEAAESGLDRVIQAIRRVVQRFSISR